MSLKNFKITRNTKLHRSKYKGKVALYRDLTISELSFLSSIKSASNKFDIAGRLVIVDGDLDKLHFHHIIEIGKSAIINSTLVISNETLFDVTVNEFKQSVPADHALNMILYITQIIPSLDLLKLLELNYKDILELTVMAELIAPRNKKFFKNNKTQQTAEKNGKNEFKSDGLSLKEKMKQDNKFYG